MKKPCVDRTVRHQVENKYTDTPCLAVSSSRIDVDESVHQKTWIFNLPGTLKSAISPWFPYTGFNTMTRRLVEYMYCKSLRTKVR